MAEQRVNAFAVNDTDENLVTKGNGATFGLVEGFIESFKMVDGQFGRQAELFIKVGEKSFKSWIGATCADSVKDPDAEIVQRVAVLKHALKALGVTQEKIDAVSKTLSMDDIEGGIEALVNLAPKDYEDKKVQIFLQYQWNIPDGQDKTYLELPKNMKGGNFLSSFIAPVGSWKEQTEWTVKDKNEEDVVIKGLRYIDDAENVHPFVKNENFMSGNKANQQFKGQNNAQNRVNGGGKDAAETSDWD